VDVFKTKQESYLVVYRSPYTHLFEKSWVPVNITVDVFRHGPNDPLNLFGYDIGGYYVP